jgi:hypothetical protein
MRTITSCPAPEREAFNQIQQPPENRAEGPSRPKTHEISLPSSQDRPLTLIKLSFSHGGHVWTATRNFQPCEVVLLRHYAAPCGKPRPARHWRRSAACRAPARRRHIPTPPIHEKVAPRRSSCADSHLQSAGWQVVALKIR